MLEGTDFIEIQKHLTSAKRILITTHTNPDGDAIGASLALYTYLTMKNHDVHVMAPDPFPEFLSWMNGQEKILIFEKQRDICIQEIQLANVIFCVDYNNLSRINEAGQYILQSQAVKILIDHHLYPSDHFDLKISLAGTSSASELIYDFIVESGDAHILNKSIAECLYAGIVTDTGSFSYSCNYVKTYLIIADLFRIGIDGEYIHRQIYDTYSESRLRLLGYSISDKLVVLPDYHTAYITLSKEDLIRFNYQVGDTEDVVNYALSIKNINLAALFMERDGMVKVSFRSKGHFSVDEIARNHFGGGGHCNASGANCTTSLEETVNKFLDLIPGFYSRLKTVY